MKTKQNNCYSTRLMKIFDIENSFQKHKQKILKIQKKPTESLLIKNNKTHNDIINQYKIIRINASNIRRQQRKDEIQKSNRLIFFNLFKEHHRSSKHHIYQTSMSRTIKSQSSTRSLASNREKIKSNEKIIEKILAAKSQLTKKAFLNEYAKTKKLKQKLQHFSKKNRQIHQISLRKMNIQPTVLFPKLKHPSTHK